MERETAIVLAEGLFSTSSAKTAHGLVRGTSRFVVAGIIDAANAGRDAGEALDGRPRGIPIFASVAAACAALATPPSVAVVGVATAGGRIPEGLRASLREAVLRGMSIVNGLHEGVAEDPELAALAREKGVRLLDVRRPRPRSELGFWTGEVRQVTTPRLAVLGTDCALGKRTTTRFVVEACNASGLRTEMIYTGQTGWMQGADYGIILDCLPNDFVSGELERAVVACFRERRPDLMILEGQSALRNPAGPCGAELLLSAGAKGVLLQHAPGRAFFEDFAEQGYRIGDLAEEIELIRLYGARVLAITLNSEGLDRGALLRHRDDLQERLGLPVVCPLEEGVDRLVPVVRSFVEEAGAH